MVKKDENVEKILSQFKDENVEFYSNFNKEMLNQCDSPIEKDYLINLLYVGELSNLDLNVTNQHEINVDNKKYKTDFHVTAVQQYTLENDEGTFVQSRSVSLCIECDGHEFHEKTKEQVKRDKQRERNMVKKGYKFIRFTGSEIYQDAKKCALETLRILIDLINKEKFRTYEL